MSTQLLWRRGHTSRQIEGITWKSLVPPGAKPPTHLNVELMAKYRPLIEKYHYDPDAWP